MTVTLVAPPSPGQGARADGPVPLAAASRPAAATRAETARAPQPVGPTARGLDIRYEDERGRPVGPPPAFQVSLLQAMQEVALAPRKPAPGGEDAFAPPGAVRMVDRKV